MLGLYILVSAMVRVGREPPPMRRQTYDVGGDELACSQEVHPEPEQGSQLSAGLIIERFVQNRFKAVQTGEHGEKQGIQIACDTLPVLGAQKLRLWRIWPNDPLDGVFKQEEEADCLFDIVFCVL